MLALLLSIFAITGMVVHILFLPLLQHVPIIFYAILGVMFIGVLVVVQGIYLRWYARKARLTARKAIRKGIKPSQIIARQLQGEHDELAGLEPNNLPDSDIDFKEIERQMRKMSKK